MILNQTYIENWSRQSKIVFRFVFCYFLLYMTLMFVSGLLEVPLRWIGKTVFSISYDYKVSGFGSGDNTFAYLTVFLNFIVAIILTIIWSFVDRKRKEYNKPFYWFTVALRFFIFAAMITYGFVKVFQIQFQPPSFVRLLEPLGDFSPMGLAWTYMGYSKGFGMFAGIMEILGGVLLVYRHTSTLGAFIVVGVMTQVAMMNLMFDIPVKLFSIHLVLMAMILFLTDSKRFLNVFISNKATTTYQFYNPISDATYHKVIRNLKKIGLTVIIIGGCILGYMGELNISDKNHRPHLYGIWETQTMIKNSDTLLPLITDNSRWRYLIIERKNTAIVKTMDDQLKAYQLQTDTITQSLTLIDRSVKTDTFTLQFSKPKQGELTLKGDIQSDAYFIALKKKPLDSFTLIKTGFNWINERPNNQ